MAAIERVEILTDGASAVYGSDAIGGVVNFITRKDFGRRPDAHFTLSDCGQRCSSLGFRVKGLGFRV